MLRFHAMMHDALRSRGLPVQAITPESRLGKLAATNGLGKWLGYIDKFVLFPAVLRGRISEIRASGKDVMVHVCDHSNARYLKYLQNVPHVITCHDLLAVRAGLGEFPKVSIRWTGKTLQRSILRELSMARHVVCDSMATRADLLRLTRLKEERVTCQYLALDPQIWRQGENVASEGDLPRRYLLHVGSDAWYKNRTGVLEIYRALGQLTNDVPDLVFVGPPPSGELRTLLSASPSMARSIRFVESVNDAELAVYYAGAEALLFPSLAEGFGWPVLEAQACGCPVILSDRPSVSEVGGSSVVRIPPDNPDKAAEIVATVLRMNTEARHELIVRGLTNAQRFSIERMVDGYLAVYRHALVEQRTHA